MKTRKSLSLAAALAAGAAGIVMTAMPAQAAGDTSRHLGCAAHWRNTATWSECQNSSGVSLQFQSKCKLSASYQGIWRYVKGSLNPVDRWECSWKAVEAFNVYR